MQANTRPSHRRHVRASPSAQARRPGLAAWRRRGTVMVYVLGVLTLVALIGLILIAKTHGEFKRVANESTASSGQVAMNGVIRVVQEMLHRDIWGPKGNESFPLSNISDAGPFEETNEPYDAPGENDRWLGSNYPYLYNCCAGTALTGHEDPPWNFEGNVLAWYRVSYLGTDVLQDSASIDFEWADNRRTPVIPGDATSYDDSSLENVLILQTPTGETIDAGGNPLPLIPGSTTNLTIAEARKIWETADKPSFPLDGKIRRFPYFDTNADGIVDLYDADGDGVPDSPISFVVPMDTADPNAPKQLYAVIRIVDHAGMLNVNVASSWELAGGSRLTFDEPTDNPQRRERRGRRVTELLLDDVAHADDTFTSSYVEKRTGGLMAYRWNDISAPDPTIYDEDVVRRNLVGDTANLGYRLYGPSDEASLRHRGMLAPYDLRDFNKNEKLSDYRTIDRALRGSLLWTRQVSASNSYLTDQARWNRLNSNYAQVGSATYEGYDNGAELGWRTLLQEDDPAAIRRPMFTTVSHEVVPPLALEKVAEVASGGSLLQPVRFPYGSEPDTQYSMGWPIIYGGATDPDLPPTWMRVQPVDINMTTNDAGKFEETKRDYIRYLAAAMYLAMRDVDRYQIASLFDLPLTPDDETLNRQWLAWQFALNMADYRDSDGEPTMLDFIYDKRQDLSRRMFGVEKQPFFTEAYAYLIAGESQSEPGHTNEPPGEEDKWFFAVELFVPPRWIVSTANLYFRTPGVAGGGLMWLGDFHRGGPTGSSPILDGGPNGNYFVFCGDTSAAPTELNNPLDAHNITTFYQNNRFEIATDGDGSIELVYSPDGTEAHVGTHVLDVMDPAYSGGRLAGGSRFGGGLWARRPALMPQGAHRAFSLLRSTQGWRFTTCWQVFTEQPAPANLPGPPLRFSLGRANRDQRTGVSDTFDYLDPNLPESVWPAQATMRTASHEPLFPNGLGLDASLVAGFTSGMPFESFDSVADISRMLMIGPARYFNGQERLPALSTFSGDNLPVTLFLAKIVEAEFGTGDLPSAPEERCAAGRVDFVNAKKPDGQPWTWRLFELLTTQSPLYDGVDNNGNGSTDWFEADVNEGADILYRVAGRININTAPVSVLRSVPYMSLLPTSAAWEQYVGGGEAIPNPALTYSYHPSLFWDYASAIVARRENRRVPLRMFNSTSGLLQTVAVAVPRESMPGPGGGGGTGGVPGPFKSVAELITLMTNQEESVVDAWGNNDKLFQIDRFGVTSDLPLWNHKLPSSSDPNLGDPPAGFEALGALSPDYRYRHDNGAATYAAIAPTEWVDGEGTTHYDVGGVRGREVFLARWANLLTTRSDVFTAYIALLDEDGNYVQRTQVTLDRSECFREDPAPGVTRVPILPKVLVRMDSSYTDDTK
ncbi:MAG: hypothetical protein JXQ75_09675 [Phycisphaerae bacterium]|nr:hypothetical protein [Phycisphaerae bacterium]